MGQYAEAVLQDQFVHIHLLYWMCHLYTTFLQLAYGFENQRMYWGNE